MIWTSLAEQAVYPQDREQCFRWFAEVKKNQFKVFFMYNVNAFCLDY